jgi:hypothetical protein
MVNRRLSFGTVKNPGVSRLPVVGQQARKLEWGIAMKIILRAQLMTDWGEVTEVDGAEFSRPARALNADTLGLSLTDGKALLQRLQQTIAGAQAEELCELHRVYQRCHRWNPVKDYRQRKIDTEFGTVRLRSPRVISCSCEPPFYLELPIFPLAPLFPERATPELPLLQAKLTTGSGTYFMASEVPELQCLFTSRVSTDSTECQRHS